LHQLREKYILQLFIINSMVEVLRRIFGLKKDEMTGEWRKLHNEELCDLYSSPIIIRIIKSRRMRWAGMYLEWGRRGTRIGCWWESQRERGC
jgi:hypothetical protein